MRHNYKDTDLDVDYYPQLLDAELAQTWYSYLYGLFAHDNKRTSLLFGDTGIIYKVAYGDTETRRLVMPWTDLPALSELKSLIEKITDQKYTVCIVQYYPTGKVGIGKHKDKEMVPGTRIAGLSIGAKRTISFTRASYNPINIELESGSLYVMNPPSNDRWLHSIVKDSKIKEGRISLTFRDYRG